MEHISIPCESQSIVEHISISCGTYLNPLWNISQSLVEHISIPCGTLYNLNLLWNTSQYLVEHLPIPCGTSITSQYLVEHLLISCGIPQSETLVVPSIPCGTPLIPSQVLRNIEQLSHCFVETFSCLILHNPPEIHICFACWT